MYALPAHTVQLVLQYISPLSDPIPPHLISNPLRQRHHFLQISPASPVQYLCWPSPDNVKVIDLLDRIPPLSDSDSFPTRYTSDSESAFAHVQISPNTQGLRMLFQWDDDHGWRYHDLRLMPFPPLSCSTPREALAGSSECSDGAVMLSSLESDQNGDDDSYWDAYGAADDGPTSPLPPQSTTDVVEGEDAYWAQYASMQGSADSTIPSPLPVQRESVDPTDDGSAATFPSQNDSIIEIPINVIHSRRLASRLEPPSPNTLAHLLNTISPRNDLFSPVRDDTVSLQSPLAYSTNPSPEQTTADSELVTPPMPSEHLSASIVSSVALKLNGVPFSDCISCPQAEDTALTDSVRGLYYLWKAGRKGGLEEKDRSVFLQIVQAAIARVK